jgi:hypothetical protein
MADMDVPAEAPRPVPRMCFERILPAHLQERAAALAIAENPENRPRYGAIGPTEAAAVTGKLWAQGRVVRCKFLAGDPQVIGRIKLWAEYPLKDPHRYANLQIAWVDSGESDIRIDAGYDESAGSWSTIGTDALVVPQSEPTMRFGWLRPDDPQADYSSVVLHEFGHGLFALIHEHQSPAANIPWNRPKVYQVLGGPPNNWSRQTIDENIFDRLAADQTQYTRLDPASIMMYPIEPELTDGKFQVGWNTMYSPTDIEFISQRYPVAAPAPAPSPTPAPGPPQPAPPSPTDGALPLPINARPLVRTLQVAGQKDLFRLQVATPGSYVISAMRVSGKSPYAVELHRGGYPAASPIVRMAALNARLDIGAHYVVVRAFDNRSTGQYALAARKMGR